MITRKRTSLIPVRIGALLVSSGMLRADHMAAALLTARQSNRKIGEVLVEQNLIRQSELNCALELQRLIKSGSITVEMGTEAMRLARLKELPFTEVMRELGWCQDKQISSNDLASILLSAGCITQPQLDQATWNAAKNCLPLGRNLVLYGAITPSLLGSALTVLIMLREQRIDEPTAISTLRKCQELKCSAEEALATGAEAGSTSHIRVGELLSLAGLLSESDAMIAVEASLLNQRSIGQVLLEYGMVSPLVLDATLKLQAMIEHGEISRAQASELLHLVAAENAGLEHFLTEVSSLRTRVLDLLLASGLVTQEMIQSALRHSSSGEMDILRSLFACGLVSQDLFRSAIRCVYSIADNSYSKEQAVAWLQYNFAPNTVASQSVPHSA